MQSSTRAFQAPRALHSRLQTDRFGKAVHSTIVVLNSRISQYLGQFQVLINTMGFYILQLLICKILVICISCNLCLHNQPIFPFFLSPHPNNQSSHASDKVLINITSLIKCININILIKYISWKSCFQILSDYLTINIF